MQLAVRDGKEGRAVYISGLPYSLENARLLLRAVMWSAHGERELLRWFSANPYVDVHAYENGKYCVVNNTDQRQETIIYDVRGDAFELSLGGGEIRWY